MKILSKYTSVNLLLLLCTVLHKFRSNAFIFFPKSCIELCIAGCDLYILASSVSCLELSERDYLGYALGVAVAQALRRQLWTCYGQGGPIPVAINLLLLRISAGYEVRAIHDSSEQFHHCSFRINNSRPRGNNRKVGVVWNWVSA